LRAESAEGRKEVAVWRAIGTSELKIPVDSADGSELFFTERLGKAKQRRHLR
jgi:hypothetical protein